MSEIVVANLFFDSDKNTGIIGGTTTDTFTIRAGSVDQLIANSTSITFPGSAVYTGNADFSSANVVGVGGISTGKAIAMAIVFG